MCFSHRTPVTPCGSRGAYTLTSVVRCLLVLFQQTNIDIFRVGIFFISACSGQTLPYVGPRTSHHWAQIMRSIRQHGPSSRRKNVIFFRNKCLNLQNVFIGKADNALLLKGITFACENTIPLITTRAWLCHVCFGQCSRSASAGHWLTPRRQPRSKTKAITFHPVQTLRAR